MTAIAGPSGAIATLTWNILVNIQAINAGCTPDAI
jgi:hypothetical protein